MYSTKCIESWIQIFYSYLLPETFYSRRFLLFFISHSYDSSFHYYDSFPTCTNRSMDILVENWATGPWAVASLGKWKYFCVSWGRRRPPATMRRRSRPCECVRKNSQDGFLLLRRSWEFLPIDSHSKFTHWCVVRIAALLLPFREWERRQRDNSEKLVWSTVLLIFPFL